MVILNQEDEVILLCHEKFSSPSYYATDISDISIDDKESSLYCHEYLPKHNSGQTSIQCTKQQMIPERYDDQDAQENEKFSDVIPQGGTSDKSDFHPMHLLVTALTIVEQGSFEKTTKKAGSDDDEERKKGVASGLSKHIGSSKPYEMISWKKKNGKSNHLLHLTKKDTQNRKRKLRFFPEKLFTMITDKSQTDPEVINWALDGEAFVISETNPKLCPILNEYFSHTKYSSLQRQLNMYGFKKATSGRYQGTFHHPSFHRDAPPSRLSAIVRKCVPPPHKRRRLPQMNTSHSRWNKMFDAFRMYQKDHGDSCDVDQPCKNCPRLCKWVMKQRHLYRDMKKGQSTALSYERIHRLNSVGFVWDTAVCSNEQEIVIKRNNIENETK